MHKGAAKIIAQEFVRGFFETLDTLLAAGIRAEVSEAEPLTPETLGDLLGKYPAVLQGRVENSGLVALLLSPTDVNRFSAQIMGEEPASDTIDTLDEAGLARALEVFEPCLGGGCGGLKETARQELSFKDVSVTQENAEHAKKLLDILGGSVHYASITWTASPDSQGEGAVLLADSLGNLLPDEVLAEIVTGGIEPEISSEDMSDILSGFSPDDMGGGSPAAATVPGNLDMVMDIRLVCTARLGRVEMPIADILDLGPGSIIEVGHLVDEPVELLVNDKLIARGDVVVVDEKFGLRITEIISPAERIKSLG